MAASPVTDTPSSDAISLENEPNTPCVLESVTTLLADTLDKMTNGIPIA
jgi:hypothetical protein